MVILPFVACSADWYRLCNFFKFLEPKDNRTNDKGNLKSRALDQNKGNKTLSYRYKTNTVKAFTQLINQETNKIFNQFTREHKEYSRRLQIRNIEMNVQWRQNWLLPPWGESFTCLYLFTWRERIYCPQTRLFCTVLSSQFSLFSTVHRVVKIAQRQQKARII